MSVTYNVYRDGVQIATGLTSTTFKDTGLTDGVTYSYQVSSVSGLIESPLSAPVLVTPLATPVVPPPPPPPTTGATYGPAIGEDGLANTVCKPGSNPQSYRFRAGQTSALVNARVYIIADDPPGYSGGNAGTARISIQGDDGSSGHYPNGTTLATANDLVFNDTTQAIFPVTFPNPANLVAGQLYHFMWTNVDPNPSVNYFSPDGLYNPSSNPYEPKYPNTDWAWLYWTGSSWYERTEQVGILDLGYANGAHEGVGYMELSYNADAGTISGSQQVRERLLTGAARTVTNGGVYLHRVSGSDPLILTLEDGSGNPIEAVSVPAASVPIDASLSGHWVAFNFAASHVLSGAYTFRWSTASSSVYLVNPIRSGVLSYGFSKSTVFPDMVACEKSSNGGSSWAPLGRVPGQNDLPFYLR